LAAVACALLATALTAPQAAAKSTVDATSPSAGDPWEKFNRSMFRFGMAIDHAFVRPVAKAYLHLTNQPVRDHIHNVIQNLDQPVVFVNDVLQLRPRRAGRTLGRFFANSTLGLAGIFDIAARDGLPQRDNDFGATLAHYGVGPGPYLFLPLLGPSTVRDLTGHGVDFVADPVIYVRFHGDTAFDIARTAVGALDDRARIDADLDSVQATAADPYAAIRSIYRQKRAADLSGGQSAFDTLPDLPADPPAEAPAEPPPQPPAAGPN
jgi:phospholipid-binding lipoprotein MlaA